MKNPAQQTDIISYFLKSPKDRRVTFSIVRKLHRPNQKPQYSILSTEQTKLLNKLFVEGKRSETSVRKEFKQIIANLYINEKKRRGDLIACDENYRVMDEYLKKKYPTNRRKQLDFRAVENETARTLRILGTQSLLSISNQALQECIDKLDAKQQKRYVARLHSILRCLGRIDIELYYSKTKRQRVTHLNKEDLDSLVQEIKQENGLIAGVSASDFSSFVKALFATGLRIGEAMALDEIDLVKSKFFIRVTKQLKQNGKISETKNKKERKAVVLPFAISDVEKWVKLDKNRFSRSEASKYLTRKTKELFKDKNKCISCHGLRHSYAIHLLRVMNTTK